MHPYTDLPFFLLLGTLLGLMQSTPPSDVRLKLDVLNTLLRIFELDRKMRAVFRDVGGFVYVMSVLINMERSLATPVNPAWAEGMLVTASVHSPHCFIHS